jgi:hypothetical protein
LVERLARAREQSVSHDAEEARQVAIRRFCRLALRGLDALIPENRQRLLRALVDEIVLREGVVEIHGVLPGRWLPSGKRTVHPAGRDRP